MNTNPLLVAAAVLRKNDLVFIAQRKEGKHLAGYWEFPGGKIELDESPQACLVREFQEEFGIEISVSEFIADYLFHYEEKTVRLISYFATLESGNIVLNDHEAFEWVRVAELKNFKLAPADVEIVEHLLTQEQSY
jgi:8-oxo-dGTP diphosphatase